MLDNSLENNLDKAGRNEPGNTSDFEPEQIINAFQALSTHWEQSYAARYSRALLNTGLYYQKDAEDEAHNVGKCMSISFITPFFIGEHNFQSFISLKQAIDRYKINHSQPAIFILGSGNTGLPLIINIIIGIIAGQHVYFRASSGNKEALDVWLSSLDDPFFRSDLLLHSIFNKIRESIREIPLSYTDPQYLKTIKSLPVQKAYLWGGSEAIAKTLSMLPDQVQSFLFGPRTGVIIFESEWWEKQSPANKTDIAHSLYDNLALYDSALCSSPTRGIMVGVLEQGRKMLQEIRDMIVPHADEQARFSRPAAQSSNNYRISMSGWKKYGYDIFSPPNSLVKIALGDIEAFHKKNKYCKGSSDYHATNGLLEIIIFDVGKMDEAAKMILTLSTEEFYNGLWGVGHIIAMAGPEIINEISRAMNNLQSTDPVLKNNKNLLNTASIRYVDIRENIGRKPGDSFDGVYLCRSMLE
jgi:hypothetical protein